MPLIPTNGGKDKKIDWDVNEAMQSKRQIRELVFFVVNYFCYSFTMLFVTTCLILILLQIIVDSYAIEQIQLS